LELLTNDVNGKS